MADKSEYQVGNTKFNNFSESEYLTFNIVVYHNFVQIAIIRKVLVMNCLAYALFKLSVLYKICCFY